MQDLEEIKQLMDLLLVKLQEGRLCPIDIIQHLKFDYYHTEKSCCQGIKLASKLNEEDPRFMYTAKDSGLVFANKASFFRGCIKISYTNH